MANTTIDMPPQLTGELSALGDYLFLTAQKINQALEDRTPEKTLQQINQALGASAALEKDTGALAEYQAIKALIIKTADWTFYESEEFSKEFASKYVAQGAFGKYEEQTNLAIKVNSTGINQLYNYTSGVRSDFADFDVERQTYIKTGLLYYGADGLPVYGVGVGELATKVQKDGKTVLDREKLLATYTADRISFWQGEAEVAYISAGALHLPSADITGGTLNIGGGRFTVDAKGKLKATDAEISGKVTATSGEIGGCEIKNGMLQVANANIKGKLEVDKINANLVTSEHLTANYLTAENVKATYATLEELHTKYLTANTVRADYATISSLNAVSARLETVEANYISANTVQTNYATINSLNAVSTRLGTVEANYIAASTVSSTYATINSLNAVSARLGTVEANYITASAVAASYATIGSLNSITISADRITTGVINPDRISTSTSYLKDLFVTELTIGSRGIHAQTYTAGITNYTARYGARSIVLDGLQTGTITLSSLTSSGSDRDVKKNIEDLPQAYEAFFDRLRPCRYKYNNGTSDRYHTGFIAQEMVQALEDSGLDTQDLAAVLHLSEEETEERGDRCKWVLRRDELVALNTWQIQKLKKAVAALEQRTEV